MKRVVIFASGSGSNAENLIKFFHNDNNVSVTQVLTNNPRAKVLERCKRLNISALYFNRIAFSKSNDVLNILKIQNPDLIILAGFLWKFPEFILNHFENKVINVHPALLPKYGGKGMYGMHVHHAVVDNKEKESGITIHYVNENYDEGAIIFQASCDIDRSHMASTSCIICVERNIVFSLPIDLMRLLISTSWLGSIFESVKNVSSEKKVQYTPTKTKIRPKIKGIYHVSAASCINLIFFINITVFNYVLIKNYFKRLGEVSLCKFSSIY